MGQVIDTRYAATPGLQSVQAQESALQAEVLGNRSVVGALSQHDATVVFFILRHDLLLFLDKKI